jgi:isopenicillin-N N-acyltransferase-like protein
MSRLRTLRITGTPSERGRAHGAHFAAEIRHYTKERVDLACTARWAGVPLRRDQVLGLAEEMIPAHRAYDADTFEEMEAMAAAAGISTAEAIVVGGFTDFVDALRARGSAPVEDNCTSVLVPPVRAHGNGWYAQTWDMHLGATDHVVLLEVRPTDRPAAWLFTTVGCVAQIGLSDAGISVGIDNITCTDGKPGVTWPFAVRKALAQRSLEAAVGAIREAPLCGGHAYHLIDDRGNGAMIEASSTRYAEWRLHGEVLAHTNHVLDPEVRGVEAVRAPELVKSSQDRLKRAYERTSGTLDFNALVELTRDPTICRHPEPPFDFETSGAVITSPADRTLWAVWGRPSEGEYEKFTL